MSKEQIGEMAKVLKDYTKQHRIMASHAILEDYAEALYNEGYRKQSENIVEVVRCKDCKHYCLSDFRKPNEPKWCELSRDGEEYPKPNDYCSRGERK